MLARPDLRSTGLGMHQYSQLPSEAGDVCGARGGAATGSRAYNQLRTGNNRRQPQHLGRWCGLGSLDG
jgi:hypothetical protein